MTYTLAIGDYAHSSWSLRGWLLLERFGLPFKVDQQALYQPGFDELLRRFSPARTVPALRLGDGTVVADTLAIAEELSTRHPDAGIWPADPRLRATARMLAAEMHSGFAPLRGACPMNLRVSYAETPVSDAVVADLRRLERIWDHARNLSGSSGPWLFGDYSAADAFFAPVAARIAGYNLPVSESAAAYTEAHLNDPAFRRWRAMGLVSGPNQPVYARDYPTRPWPGPLVRPAAVSDGPSVNDRCPFSGRPASHFAEISGWVIGFCNAFCRDKAAADAEAWPEVRALLAT